MPMMYGDHSYMSQVVPDSDQSNSVSNQSIFSLKDGLHMPVYFVIFRNEMQSELNEEPELETVDKYLKSICDNATCVLFPIMVDMKNLDVDSLKDAREKNIEVHILIADKSINTQYLIVHVDYGCNSDVESSIGNKGFDIKVNKFGVGETKIHMLNFTVDSRSESHVSGDMKFGILEVINLIGDDIGNIDIKKLISVNEFEINIDQCRISFLQVSSASRSCTSLCSSHLHTKCLKSEISCVCRTAAFEGLMGEKHQDKFESPVSYSLMITTFLSKLDCFKDVQWLIASSKSEKSDIFYHLGYNTSAFHQLFAEKFKYEKRSLLPCNVFIQVMNCSEMIKFNKNYDGSCTKRNYLLAFGQHTNFKNKNIISIKFFENNFFSMETGKTKAWRLHVHATTLLADKGFLEKQFNILKHANNVIKTMDSRVGIEEPISIFNSKYSMKMLVKFGSFTCTFTRNKVVGLFENLDMMQYECVKSKTLLEVILTPGEFVKIENISSAGNSIDDTAMNHVFWGYLEMKRRKCDVSSLQLWETIHTSIVCANEQTLLERVKLHCIKALLLYSDFEDESEMSSLLDMRLLKIHFKNIILSDFMGNKEDKLVLINVLMKILDKLYLYKSYNVAEDETPEIHFFRLWKIPYKLSVLIDFIGNIEDILVLKKILDTLCLYTTYKVADDETVKILNGSSITLKECGLPLLLVDHMLTETDEHKEEWRIFDNFSLENLEAFSDQYSYWGNKVLLLRNALYENDDNDGTILTWLLHNLYEDDISKITERKEEQYFIKEKIPLRNIPQFFTETLCILKRYKYQVEKFMNFHLCEYETFHCYLLQLWLFRNTNLAELFHFYYRTAYSIDNQIPYMQQQKEIKLFLLNHMTTYRHKSLHDRLVKVQGELENVRICKSTNIYLPTPARIDRDNCQLSCKYYALLGISCIIAQVTVVVLKNLVLVNDCDHETKSRKKNLMNICLLLGLVSLKQIISSCEAHIKEGRTIHFPGKCLSKVTQQETKNPEKNVMLKEMVKDVLTSDCKSVKSILYDIINHDEIFRNVEITAYPVNSNNGMSNEILRVGSLNNFPSENSPSLIKLAKYGFYYEGKGREVTCFSCGIKHEDWSYRSNPLEVHRQISPYCEYLKTFRPSIDIIENDCRQNATPRMPTTEISHVNGLGADSVRTCTDAHGMTPTLLISSSPMTVAVQSVDSGLFESSLSHSSNNLVTSNSTSSSSISQGSSRASTDSGFGSSGSRQSSRASTDSGFGSSGSRQSSHASTGSGFGSSGSLSSNQSSSSSNTSNLTVPQLQPLIEGPEHSIQRVSGPTSRDSPVSQNNRKNTSKEKYPEYIPIERRRATYKNWPPNLDFLHPLDLSECGFFYSNFGDCVRCFHCGIGLRNWESDDNPWVEHARWSRKCPYLLQKKGQEFIDSVLTVLGIQTDSEIEMQTANAGTEQTSQVSSGYGTASSNDVRDPICHPAAQYIIRENIFGDNKEKQVKKTMNQLLQLHEWDDVTNDMLVNALLESKDVMENLDTKTNSVNLSQSAVSNSSGSKTSNTQSTGTEDKNKEEDSKKSTEENPEKIQKENEELKELYTCKICLDERVGITFVPCGHLVTCKTCSPKIRRCPLCRTFIRGTIKTTI